MSREPVNHVVRRKWTRRDFFKAAPLAAVGVGVGGLALSGRGTPTTERTTGTCRFCLMRCGIECVVEDGRLVKVEGSLTSKTRGFVCEHGFALRELVHSNDRVQHPLIRRGDSFHEVSWEEALQHIAQKLTLVKTQHGARALAIQTGWPFVRHPMVNFLHRFARAYGSPNVATVSSLCEASLRMGQALTVGSKYSAELRRTKTLLVWGANPSVTAPPFAHLVADKARTGNLVVIDPVRTTLAKEATLHLHVRPGTDGALALGLIHQVLTRRPPSGEKLHGLAELTALAAEYPLERVEQLTSVPREKLERLVKMLLEEAPIGIWQGLGVEHHTSGVQTVRAITSLEVLCGRFEGVDPRSLVTPNAPDFHEQMLPALYRMRTPKPAPPPISEQAVGHERFPLFDRYNREAQGELLAEAILRDAPYPVRALILWGSNALITSSGTQAMEAAAEKLDLLVTVDPFFSASAQRSDVVLPACTFAESPDVDADETSVAAKGLVPVQGSSKPDFTILTELARACGLGEWFPWNSFAVAMRAPRVEWMRDEAMQPKPRADARTDFGTPTGKAEFFSTVLEEAGLEPLPVWSEPVERTSVEFPLRLVTGPRARARINSQFAQSPSIRARMGEAELLVHPRLGIVDGSMVDVVSPHGRISIRAVVTEDVHPECVVMPAGWAEANPNLLISNSARDPISGFPALRSGVCRLEVRPSP
ncbi:MAG: molybdopterin-dependent oxidoreductase [Archangium sp.]|nr:molybdopterin-dependent oxidoreductase [Archangium sp.]MDP3571199.1 molybdopterin-dependent oxidoreductase [Archangium sp.]